MGGAMADVSLDGRCTRAWQAGGGCPTCMWPFVHCLFPRGAPVWQVRWGCARALVCVGFVCGGRSSAVGRSKQTLKFTYGLTKLSRMCVR